MTETSKEQSADRSSKTAGNPGLFKQTRRNLAGRFFQITDRHKHAPLVAAAAVGGTVFTLGAGALSVRGISGAEPFLRLAVASLAVFGGVLSALLYRARAQSPVPLPEIRKELDQLRPRISHEASKVVDRIVAQYENFIYDLQDARVDSREIPGDPMLIRGGRS